MKSRIAAAIGGVVTALACVGGSVAPLTAQAQEPLPIPEVGIPGAPALPDIPGLPGMAGGEEAISAAVNAASGHPLVANAMNTAGAVTPDPEVETSTNPTCAPIVFVAVPGTFEINRDFDPNEPVGMLASLAEPLRASLGDGFSETYINYNADAGVSGTSYAQSVQMGTEKTLATIQDVQDRCAGSRVLLSGFSQGADIAGDAATLIGNGQTSINPSTMAGTVLFADPQRQENSNVLVGSTSPIPELPAGVSEAINEFLDDPAIAERKITGEQLTGLAGQLMNGGQQAPAEANSEPKPDEVGEDAPAAGEADKPANESANAAPKNDWRGAAEVKTGGLTLAAPKSPATATDSTGAVSEVAYTLAADETAVLPDADAEENDDVSAEETVEEDAEVEGPATLTEIPEDDLSEDVYDTSYAEEMQDKASGVIVPGRLGETPRPAFSQEMTAEEVAETNLGHGQVWATEANLVAMDEFNATFAEETGESVPAPMTAETMAALDEMGLTALQFHHQVGDLYRAGLCEAKSFEDCVSFYSGGPGIAALAYDLNNLPEENPENLAGIPEGNLMETRCAIESATNCALTSGKQESTLPAAVIAPASNETAGEVEAVDDEEAGAQSSNEAKASSQKAAPVESAQSSTPTASQSAPQATQQEPTEAKETQASTTSAAKSPAGEAAKEDESSVEASASESSLPAAAGMEERPTTETSANGSEDSAEETSGDSTDVEESITKATGSTTAEAGEDKRPTTEQSTTATSKESTTSTAPQAGEDNRPTTEPSEPTADSDSTDDPDTADKPEQSAGEGSGIEIEGVEPITMEAVAGGGVAGPREQDFGSLTGSVVSLCVPGDIVCSLPENSQLAHDLVDLGQNVSTNLTGVAKAAMEGNTRMGGLLAVETVNTVFQIAGLPDIKVSQETIEMLIKFVSGGAMIVAGDPSGAGVALIASAIPQLPEALPELYAQLQDIPAIIEALPDAGDTAARNLGLEDISNRLTDGFENVGMTDITDAAQLPTAAVSMSTDLLEENSGLMELATNPDYLKTGAHSEGGFRSIMLSETLESFAWTQEYMAILQRLSSTVA